MVLIGGYISALSSLDTLRSPPRLWLFTALILAHGALYWLGPWLARTKRHLVVYCFVQAVLVLAIGLLTSNHWLVMGLYPALTGLFVGALWPDMRATILAALGCLALMAFNLIVSFGIEGFVQFLPFIGIMMPFVVVYVVLFTRQVSARERAQELLGELEAAHAQLQAYADRVEELTIIQERERMARELHDTLAQGVAGLIMQLEAVDSHLESENQTKAQEVVQQAMQRARTTLDEARRAIRALRPAALEQGGLIDALGRDVDRLVDTEDVQATFEVEGGPLDVSPEVAQEVLRIVQESLSNVARHAGAEHVLVRLAESDGVLRVVVQDDGEGFDLGDVGGSDRFGLAGMEERAERLGGALWVESEPGQGTKVTLEIAV
jgi:NarL family two-component system sensor histidine kinase YdfH